MIAQLDADYVRTRPSRLWARLLAYGLFEGRPLTTRGRFVNPLVFALARLWESMPPLVPVERPVFILGTGRSGTTVLGKVLSMHRQVGFLNEPKALWHRICPDEDLVGSYSHGTARVRLYADDADPCARTRARRLFGAYLALSGARRVVDKYPELVFRVPYVRALFPDARFLLLVRDGYDTAQSVAAWSRRHGADSDGERHDWWGRDDRKWRLLSRDVLGTHAALGDTARVLAATTDQRLRAAIEWTLAMQEGACWQRELPDHVMTVRYEDLVSQPRDLLISVAAFCGLDEDSTFLDYGARVLKADRHHARFDLPASLATEFARTMVAFGYRP